MTPGSKIHVHYRGTASGFQFCIEVPALYSINWWVQCSPVVHESRQFYFKFGHKGHEFPWIISTRFEELIFKVLWLFSRVSMRFSSVLVSKGLIHRDKLAVRIEVNAPLGSKVPSQSSCISQNHWCAWSLCQRVPFAQPQTFPRRLRSK
jgi:hypothetical protein